MSHEEHRDVVDEPPTLDVRRRRYNRVLSALDHNTGDPQRPMCLARTLWTVTIANGDLGHDEARKSFKAATNNNHAIRWRDDEGQPRYGLTVEGAREHPTVSLPIYDDSDADALRRIIDVETTREEPDTDIVGWANKHLATLSEDNDAR